VERAREGSMRSPTGWQQVDMFGACLARPKEGGGWGGGRKKRKVEEPCMVVRDVC